MPEVQVKISVSTIITNKEGKHLLVYEKTPDGFKWNQPTGHLETGETPQQGAVREALEETGFAVKLTGFVGSYLMQRESNGASYLRLCFCGEIDELSYQQKVNDPDIISTTWWSVDELLQNIHITAMRNPMVLQCVEDFNNGKMFPVDTVNSFFI